jgi:hypothetical protein
MPIPNGVSSGGLIHVKLDRGTSAGRSGSRDSSPAVLNDSVTRHVEGRVGVSTGGGVPGPSGLRFNLPAPEAAKRLLPLLCGHRRGPNARVEPSNPGPTARRTDCVVARDVARDLPVAGNRGPVQLAAKRAAMHPLERPKRDCGYDNAGDYQTDSNAAADVLAVCEHPFNALLAQRRSTRHGRDCGTGRRLAGGREIGTY